MKCPRCETNNDNRSVCTNCGMFLYDGRTRNRVRLSPTEKRKQTFRTLRQMLIMMLKFSGVLMGLLILSLLVIWAVQRFS